MKFKLIVSDYDSTMAIKGVVFEQTVNAIKEYERAGGKFVVCTGRTPSSIKAKALKYGFSTFSACHQGSVIMDVATGETAYNGGVDSQLASLVVKEIRKEYPITAYIGDELLYDTDCRYVQDLMGLCPCTKVEDLSEEIKRRGEKINRIVVSATDDVVENLIEKYSKKFGKDLCINSGVSYIIEIVAKEYSKKQAVEFFAKYFNLPYSQIMVVGDSTNDLPLFDGEWYGVAVGNAHEKLKQVANEITVPVQEHPIKVLIEKYCLGENDEV